MSFLELALVCVYPSARAPVCWLRLAGNRRMRAKSRSPFGLKVRSEPGGRPRTRAKSNLSNLDVSILFPASNSQSADVTGSTFGAYRRASESGTLLSPWPDDDDQNRSACLPPCGAKTPTAPPVSAWWHDFPREWSADGIAEATLEAYRKYDWDFVKVNPRACYYAEDWGAKYVQAAEPGANRF